MLNIGDEKNSDTEPKPEVSHEPADIEMAQEPENIIVNTEPAKEEEPQEASNSQIEAVGNISKEPKSEVSISVETPVQQAEGKTEEERFWAGQLKPPAERRVKPAKEVEVFLPKSPEGREDKLMGVRRETAGVGHNSRQQFVGAKKLQAYMTAAQRIEQKREKGGA